MTSVSLCAIQRNEARSLLEWVAYHRLLRFDRIVVYDNESTDGSPALLDGLARLGALTHRFQPTGDVLPPQQAAYRDALLRCDTEWALFIDLDEFLVLKADATVQAFASRFAADVGAVALHWRVFGSAGRETYDDAPVIERFPRAAEIDHSVNTHYKSLVRPAFLRHMHVHHADLSQGAHVNADGDPLDLATPGRARPVATARAQINHYCVKSREEFDWKKRRGAADRLRDDPARFTSREGSGYFPMHDRNECEDLALFERRDEVRAEMARLSEGLRRDGLLQFR